MSDILNAMLPAKVIKFSSRRDLGFKRGKLLEIVIHFINKKFNLVLCPSKAVQQKVVSEGVDADKTFLIYNGIDTKKFIIPTENKKKQMWKSLGLKDKCSHYICIGNLNDWKGHRFIVEAIGLLKSKGVRVQLVIFGDGPARTGLETQISKLGLEDDVTLKGFCVDAKYYLSCFDLMVLPSITEGLSNALLEGAASSLPLIATDVGGNPEIVKDGINGRLVPIKNSKALADALEEYQPNTKLHQAAAKSSRNIVENQFSLATMISTYNNLFLQFKA
jgi:glycosyltransferase involved in cell wall biosynthesis